MYTSIRASHTPTMLPELMAYMSHIIRVHQDYSGLAWVRYDAAFCRQAALTSLQKWSMINPTLYSICFTGVARATSRHEICSATSGSLPTRDCAQQGTPEPGMLDRVKTLESMVLSLSAKSTLPSGSSEAHSQQVEICRLWNKNKCSFPRCPYRHV